MRQTLFTNAVIHTGRTESEVFSAMLVEKGLIRALYSAEEAADYAGKAKVVDLLGRHVYPCLIDGHVHMLLTIAVMAMGFNLCQITAGGVEPRTMKGVEERLRNYVAAQKSDAVIACNNYIMTAIDEHRMPTREELDEWGGGRPVVIYNIDGHSTSLSTKMLELVGISPQGHSGILQGEENERAQGRIIDTVSSMITLPVLAKGIAGFQNACASYGISVVGALEGNGDSPRDPTTRLIAALARRFDVGVRLYPQYVDLERVRPYRKWMSRPRAGGCGDWEMDGSVGSHSAAFSVPFSDTGKTAPCYYTQEYVDQLVLDADKAGYQIASHAIGEAAVERLLHALERLDSPRMHRVEHCEFVSEESFRTLCKGKYAVMMQPGYSWIDKRYLHTYEQYLPAEILQKMRLRSLVDAGVCVCGSSDSPVQDMDPYLQMLGMVQFYREEESLTPYQAFRCYTANAAKSIEEEAVRGTLEPGKAADFFTADRDFFTLSSREIVDFRPIETWYGGKKYRQKRGTVPELLAMLLRKPEKI